TPACPARLPRRPAHAAGGGGRRHAAARGGRRDGPGPLGALAAGRSRSRGRGRGLLRRRLLRRGLLRRRITAARPVSNLRRSRIMAYETIRYELTEGVATITLSRPQRLNAFNDEMIRETTAALRDAGRDAAVRCVVITGEGRAFSSGQDLADVQERQDGFSIGEHLRTGYNRLIKQMVTLEKPVIGAINGVAAGAGCSVALACDLRIAADSASFIEVFSKVGLIPDSGST